MSRFLEVPVEVEALDGMLDECIIEVMDIDVSKGDPGHCSPRGDCPGCPPEPACIDGYTARWKGSEVALNDAEIERYGQTIEDAIWDSLPTQADMDADEGDRAYDRWKDREMETHA